MTTSAPKIAPLNPSLYNLLTHKFGSVRVHNQGCSAQSQFVRDPTQPTGLIEVPQVAGEYYAVCCPFCHESNYKLWINYRYGSTYDNRGRREKTYLACCYRNGCLSIPGRRAQLEDLIFGQHRRGIIPAPVSRISGEVFRPIPVVPPGDIVPLTELPEDHPAIVYLRGRNFDPAELTAQYAVGFCSRADAGRAVMQGRIYIPIVANKELIGWQGRAVGDGITPKYYNLQGTPKSRTLYNYDHARQQPYCVIVEGVPSVWRIGPAAVCLFGKTMSYWQRNTITTTWAQKPIFILLDNDAAAETEACYRDLCSDSASIVIPVFLPDSRDPADYSRAELTDILNSTAAAVGVSAAVHL